jgi:hypothetical protein
MALKRARLFAGGPILQSGDRTMSAELEAKRTRLSLVERELLQLGTRHDLAMSAFRFDEARDLQQRITLLELERAELIAALPTPAPLPPARTVAIGISPNRRRPQPH